MDSKNANCQEEQNNLRFYMIFTWFMIRMKTCHKAVAIFRVFTVDHVKLEETKVENSVLSLWFSDYFKDQVNI